MPDHFADVLSTGKFLFEVDSGMEIGRFSEVSGLSVEVQVETVEEGGENHFVHKLPGRMSWPNLVFKRGVTRSDNLFTWLTQSSGEGFEANGSRLRRRSASVVLLALDGTTRLRTWAVTGAFPVRWAGPSFDAASASPAVEELEIAHHGFSVSS